MKRYALGRGARREIRLSHGFSYAAVDFTRRVRRVTKSRNLITMLQRVAWKIRFTATSFVERALPLGREFAAITTSFTLRAASISPPSWNWTYDKGEEKCDYPNCERKDPVNLIFLLSLNKIARVLARYGWNAPIAAWDQHIHIDTIPRAQNMQLVLGNLAIRYHVRIWELGDRCIGNAHFEALSFRGRHVVRSHENGEQSIASIFEQEGFSVTRNLVDLSNALSRPYNDGRATEIRR